MHPLPDLPRSWPSIELPGYREHPTVYATYSGFEYDELPPIERELDDDLRWLLAEPPVPDSLAYVDEAASHELESAPAPTATSTSPSSPSRLPAAAR